VGTGKKVSLDDTATATLNAAWKKRDKLNHPLLPKDLEISPRDGIAFSLAFTNLELLVHRCTEIDLEKWKAASHRGRDRRSVTDG
jgi:hypothetical protein